MAAKTADATVRIQPVKEGAVDGTRLRQYTILGWTSKTGSDWYKAYSSVAGQGGGCGE